jgi:hypothetical protein
MQREPLTGDLDPRRQRIAEPQTISKRTKSMQADVGDDLVAAASTTTGTVLLALAGHGGSDVIGGYARKSPAGLG